MKIKKRKFTVLLLAAAACLFYPWTYSHGGEDPGWPIFRGDQSLTGFAKGSIPDKLRLLWTFRSGDEIRSSPVVGRGRVFIGSADGKIYALNLIDGKKIWEFDTGNAIEAPPLLVNETVYIGSLSGIFYALNAGSGELKWKYETGNRIAGSANWIPAGKGKGIRILVGSYDNMMHCVDSDSGKKVWTYQTDNFINGSPSVSEAFNGIVVFGGCDAQIHLISARKGTEIAVIDTGSYIAASVAVSGNHAFVGNYAGKL